MHEILNDIEKDLRFGDPFSMNEGVSMQLGTRFIHCSLRPGIDIAYCQINAEGKINFVLPGLEDVTTFLQCISKGMFRKIPEVNHVIAYFRSGEELLKLYLPC